VIGFAQAYILTKGGSPEPSFPFFSFPCTSLLLVSVSEKAKLDRRLVALAARTTERISCDLRLRVEFEYAVFGLATLVGPASHEALLLAN
jgi:hypothetical protein